MFQKLIRTTLALAILGLITGVATASAKHGADDPAQPPQCQIEDGGVLVCK